MNSARSIKMSFVLLAVLIAGCATGTGVLSIEEVWSRPGLANGNTAVYFSITNPTRAADRLLSASANVAKRVEVHLSSIGEDGVMKMEMQEEVPVPANTTVAFRPGGYHVMLINLVAPLEDGDSFELTLEFENAGVIQLDVVVEER